MVNYVQNRYTEAKWQAFVTPESKAFKFADGTTVRSLWQLKQALQNVSEDVIMGHIREKENDIANWIEFVVGDAELAGECRKYNHRWGLIVALERQMMRTLNLPSCVAKRWLAKTEYPFTFVSGETADSLESLAASLGKISDETFNFHLERIPNDVSKWVMDVIGDYELADVLEESSHREQMQRFVEDHVVMLKEALEA